jgi:hypothetical protein
MNEVVALHRQAQPNDPHTDAEITQAYGDMGGPALLAKYPKFAADYAALKAPAAQAATADQPDDDRPSFGQEFGHGVSSGISGLQSAGYGAAALAANVVGARETAANLLERAQDKEADAADNAPTIANIRDAKTAGDYARYGLYQGGTLFPNIAEAVGTGLAGAAIGAGAGTTIGPEGTVAGGVGGALYGLLESKATTATIKALVEASIKKAALGEGVALTAEQAAAQVATEAGKAAVVNTAKGMLKEYGVHTAETVNFWAQSAGSTYNKLTQNPEVDPGTAMNVAIFGGLAQAVPGQFLPSYVLGKFFGAGNTAATGPYFLRLAKEAGKVIPGGVAAMDMQEAAAIASEKYADPKTRNDAFDFSKWTDADRDRLVNASVTGGLAGLIGAPVAALPRGDEAVAAKTGSGESGKSGEPGGKTSDESKVMAAFTGTPGESTDGKTEGEKATMAEEQRIREDVLKGKPSDVPGATTPPPAATDAAIDIKGKIAAQPPEAFVNNPEKLAGVKAPTPPPEPEQPASSSPSFGFREAFTGTNSTDDLYRQAFSALQNGKTTIAGVTDPILAKARPFFDAGKIKSPDDIKALVQSGELDRGLVDQPVNKPSAPVPPAQPAGQIPETKPVVSVVTPSVPTPPTEITADKAPVKPVVTEPVKTAAEPVTKVTEAPAPVAKPVEAVNLAHPPITLNDIAFDMDSGKVRGEHEPAYFDITAKDREDPRQLERRLADQPQSAEDARAPYTETKRVTAVRDNETGKVQLLGSYEQPADTKRARPAALKVADPAGGKKNIYFRDLLAAKTPGGAEKYTPIASLLLNGRRKGHVEEFANQAEFVEKLGYLAKEKVLATAHDAQAGREALERVTDPNAAHVDAEPEELPQKNAESAKGIAPEHVEALEAVFSGDEGGVASEKDFKADFFDQVKSSPEAVDAFKALAKDAAEKNPDVPPLQLVQAIRDKIYEAVKAGHSEGPEGFGKSLRASLGGEAARTGKPAAEAAQPSAGLQRAEQQRQGQERLGQSNPETVTLRQPQGVQEVQQAHAAMLGEIHEAATTGGLQVRVLAQGMSNGAQDFASRTGASFDAAHRMITQVVGDVVGKQDVITGFHEVAHAVFDKLPPPVRALVTRVIDGMSDRALGVDLSADPRIRQGNPMNVPNIGEERLVEATAMRLADVGFSPKQAQGFAQSFVRALKDVYLRGAMAVQRALLGEAFVNPELAQRFFQNKVERFLAGDFQRSSFVDWLGGGKPSDAKRATWHAPTGDRNSLFERLGSDGKPGYEYAPDDDLAAVQFNSLRYRQPDLDEDVVNERAGIQTGRKLNDDDRVVEANKQIAPLNHLAEQFAIAAKDERVIAAAKEAGLNPVDLLVGHSGVTDPKEAIKKIQSQALKTGGSQPPVDPTKTIEGFSDKSNAADVVNRTFAKLSGLVIKLSGRILRDKTNEADVVAERESAIEDNARSKATYLDWQGSTSMAVKAIRNDFRDLFKSMARTSKQQGVIEQQLRALDPHSAEGSWRLRDYLPVFQRLFTGKQLDGENLFTMLNKLANDPHIDFRDDVSEIRDAMRQDTTGDYAKLIGNDKESLALLSTVVGYAKLHLRDMGNFELRSMPDAAERVAITKRIAEDAQSKQDALKSLGELARNASTEERLRLAYRDDARKVARLTKKLQLLRTRQETNGVLADVVRRANDKLAIKNGIGPTVVFRDEMPYNVPETADAKTGSDAWTPKKVAIDTRTPSKVRDALEIEADVRKMREFLAHREAASSAGDQDALDSQYIATKREADELDRNVNFRPDVSATTKFFTELGLAPVWRQVAEAFNTISARAIQALGQGRFERIKDEMHEPDVKAAHRTAQLEDVLIKLMPAKTYEARETLRKSVLDPAKARFEYSPGIAEQHPNNPKAQISAVMNRIMSDLAQRGDTREWIKGNEQAWRDGIHNLLEHHNSVGERQIGIIKREGLGVRDARLLGPDGKPLERQHQNLGPWTFQRTLDRKTFKTMVAALRGSGWAGGADGKGSLAAADFKTIGALINSGPDGMAKTQALVGKYFNHPEHGQQVRDAFFRAITEMESKSPLPAPKLSDGVTRPPADTLLIHTAYERSKGDPLAFWNAMWDLHNGQDTEAGAGKEAQNRGTYIQDGMEKLADIAGRADGMLKDIEPDPTIKDAGIKGMFSNAFIDARSIDDLPSQWFTYHSMDEVDLHKSAERIAAESAFGRDGERLQAHFQTLAGEVSAAQTKLDTAMKRATAENPQWSARKIRSAAEKDAGPVATRMAKNAPLLQRSIGDLSTFFRKDNSPDGTLRALQRWGNLLGGLMANNPASAITLLSHTMALNLKWGVGKSVLRATAGTVKDAGKELAASLASTVGIQMFNGGENARLFAEGNYADSGTVNKFADNFDRLSGEGNMAFAARSAQGVLGTGINPLGENNQHTVFRPLQPFLVAYEAVNRAVTYGTWNIARQYLMKGMEFYKANLDKLNDPTFKLTPDNLGLKRLEKDSFARFHGDIQKYDLNYDRLVREALQRPDGTVFGKETAAKLYTMAANEISLESSTASRPLAGFNNQWLKAALPLLGWSFARTRQIAELRLNPDGRMEMKALITGMAGLSVMAGGGLAVSMLVDQYYEKLLGKERNLRPLFGSSDPQEFALSVLENMNRVGTTGLFGELANTILGTGGGADNRMISVDQRVLAVSSLQSIMQAGSAFWNQGFNADYAHVIRPFFGAVGGGGMLQYIDIANHSLGLDNVEARETARINAQNYLRVVGRELQLDVRTPDGSSSNPTPVTPYLTQMEFAAYGNSAGDFQSAYTRAIAAAKAAGQPDPVEYVKRAFSGRNPLRSVFRTAISEAEYHRLLANMPGSGSQDVSQAVNLFNHYATVIGAKPFDGKTDKPEPAFGNASEGRSDRVSLALK